MIRRISSSGCKKVHRAVSNKTESSELRHNNTQLCILYSTQKLRAVDAEAYLIIHPVTPTRKFSGPSFYPVFLSLSTVQCCDVLCILFVG
jgi:hypothetical protein